MAQKLKHKSNSYSKEAIYSFILGILFLVPLVGGLFGLAAILFGLVALVKIHLHGFKGRGLAWCGIVMGAIGVFGMVTFYGLLIYGFMHLH